MLTFHIQQPHRIEIKVIRHKTHTRTFVDSLCFVWRVNAEKIGDFDHETKVIIPMAQFRTHRQRSCIFRSGCCEIVLVYDQLFFCSYFSFASNSIVLSLFLLSRFLSSSASCFLSPSLFSPSLPLSLKDLFHFHTNLNVKQFYCYSAWPNCDLSPELEIECFCIGETIAIYPTPGRLLWKMPWQQAPAASEMVIATYIKICCGETTNEKPLLPW